MMQENEWKKTYRIMWLDSLDDLANLDLQKLRWLNPNLKNQAWTYVEFMSKYFDDCVLEDGYESKIHDGYITLEEYNCIKNFHEMLDEYTPPKGSYDHESILNDPQWIKIVRLGRKSLVKLLNTLKDPEEKQRLFVSIPPLRVGDFTWPH